VNSRTKRGKKKKGEESGLTWPTTFLVLQGRSASVWWWQRWLRHGGESGQSGGQEEGKGKNTVFFSLLWLLIYPLSGNEIQIYL